MYFVGQEDWSIAYRVDYHSSLPIFSAQPNPEPLPASISSMIAPTLRAVVFAAMAGAAAADCSSSWLPQSFCDQFEDIGARQ